MSTKKERATRAKTEAQASPPKRRKIQPPQGNAAGNKNSGAVKRSATGKSSARPAPIEKPVTQRSQKSRSTNVAKVQSEAAARKTGAKVQSKPPKGAKVPIGGTLKTQDKYLPHDPKKVQELKDKRWVVVIDKNTNEELAVIRLTDERQPNTTELPTYKKGNKRKTYFKHFVEITDNEGNAIRVDGKKFIKNAAEYDLSKKELKLLRDKVLNHSKQSQENRNKILVLKNKKPRD